MGRGDEKGKEIPRHPVEERIEAGNDPARTPSSEEAVRGEAVLRLASPNNATRGPSATGAPGFLAVRAIRIWIDMNDEGAPVFIEHRKRSFGQSHARCDGQQVAPSAVVNSQIDQITSVERVVAIRT